MGGPCHHVCRHVGCTGSKCDFLNIWTCSDKSLPCSTTSWSDCSILMKLGHSHCTYQVDDASITSWWHIIYWRDHPYQSMGTYIVPYP